MAIICHICKVDEWEASKASGEFFPESSRDDALIKCSFPAEAMKIFSKKYKEHKDRIILMIDLSKLTSKVKYDGKGKKQKNPRILGSINVDAVTDVFYLTPVSGKTP